MATADPFELCPGDLLGRHSRVHRLIPAGGLGRGPTCPGSGGIV